MHDEQLQQAVSAELLTEAGRLFADYAAEISVNLEYQGFSSELATLPGDYGPPDGAILLYMEGQLALGCVALRKLEPGICEMKRMYVSPAGRGRHLGRLLAQAVIEHAKKLGYQKMRLDTLKSMTAARGLYQSLGFQQIGAYCHNPLPDPEFYELDFLHEPRSKYAQT